MDHGHGAHSQRHTHRPHSASTQHRGVRTYRKIPYIPPILRRANNPSIYSNTCRTRLDCHPPNIPILRLYLRAKVQGTSVERSVRLEEFDAQRDQPLRLHLDSLRSWPTARPGLAQVTAEARRIAPTRSRSPWCSTESGSRLDRRGFSRFRASRGGLSTPGASHLPILAGLAAAPILQSYSNTCREMSQSPITILAGIQNNLYIKPYRRQGAACRDLPRRQTPRTRAAAAPVRGPRALSI